MDKGKRPSASALRRLVERRAGRRCEYCHAPQDVCGYRFHLDHIVPKSRGGSDMANNRALACATCNLAKTDRELLFDPRNEQSSALFLPRMHSWEEHFEWAEDLIRLNGRTAIGEASINALDMNNELRFEARRLWFATGWLP